MTPLSSKTGELLTRLLGKAVGGPVDLVRAIAVATLSVAETLTTLLTMGVAEDIHRVKKATIKKLEAEGDKAAAEAKKMLAEATEAANRATLHKRNGVIAQIEERQLKANAAKTEAEAEAIRMDAETRRQQAITEAQAKLTETISKLQQEGGQIYFDKKNLQKIIKMGLPPELEATRSTKGGEKEE
jgi:t-SNARE complex subunit (syntaxin)